MADPKKGMNVTDEPPIGMVDGELVQATEDGASAARPVIVSENDDDWDAAAAGDDEDDLSDLDDMEF